MPDAQTEAAPHSASRRTIVKGAAWAVPAIMAAAPAAQAAASVRNDPGINGWVLNSPTSRGSCRYYLRVNSNPSDYGPTPDGAPFGLYLYDTQLTDAITNAKITYWIIGEQREGATWSTNGGHSSCWGNPVKGTPAIKNDGLLYTPYTWSYSCAINPNTVDSGGRVWLGEFDVTASFRQPSSRCDDVTYWTQRHVTVNGEVLTFERRNGTRGTYPGGNGYVAPQGGSDPHVLDSQIEDINARVAALDAEIQSASTTSLSAGEVASTGEVLPNDAAEVTAQPGDTPAATETEPTVDTAALTAERAKLLDERAALEAEKAASQGDVSPVDIPSLPS